MMRVVLVAAFIAAFSGAAAWAQTVPSPNTFSDGVLSSPPAQALGATDVLPIIQPTATPSMRNITPFNLVSNNGFAYANACNPVAVYGADPTGATPSDAAINKCNGGIKNGQYVNTYLPGGTYYLKNALTQTQGQCLIGEPGLTVLSVGYDFNPSAVGVLTPGGGGAYGGSSIPCIRDVMIIFAQPANIGSRANFATLSAGCGNNGKGCQYPPAITFNNAQRIDLDEITIINAWDCISGNGSNAGDGNDRWGIIRCGAFDRGLNLSGIKDIIHIDGFYFWPYGMTPANNANIFQDGSTLAANLAEVDGFDADLFFSIYGQVVINSSNGWFHFKTLMLDSNNAELTVTAAAWVTISGGYASGGPSGAPNCGIINNGSSSISLTITNFRFTNGGARLICNAGSMAISNSVLVQQTNNAAFVDQTAGNMIMTGNLFYNGTTGPWSIAAVDVSAGSIVMTGNYFSPVPTGGAAVSIADNANNVIANNTFNGWSFSAPGSLGSYWPNQLNSAGDTGSAYVKNGNAVADLDAAAPVDAIHYLATGYTNHNLQAWFGVDTTAQHGIMQAYKQGTGALDLLLEPLGGNVHVGAFGTQTRFQVDSQTANPVIGFGNGQYGASLPLYNTNITAVNSGTASSSLLNFNVGSDATSDTVTAMTLRGDGLAAFAGNITAASLPTSAGSGGVYLCVDNTGVVYKKSACP